jgi:predicted flap endonuclease-1-like 5' DNA nuclease
MTWLIAHMWIILGGAVVLSLLLGWSLRGAALVGRLRRAEVERELVRVELSEAREEIERLFAVQRKIAAQAQVSDPEETVLRQQLAEAAAELQAVRAELGSRKEAAPPEAPVAAPQPEAPAGIAPAVFESLARRAAELEAALSASEAARAAEAARPGAGAPPLADAKLAWQVGYLRQRAHALETELLRRPQVSSAGVSAGAPQPEPAEPATGAQEGSVEQELARLRWRNRYLEGRLAYLEGDAESVAEELAEQRRQDVVGEGAPPDPPFVSEAIPGKPEAAGGRADAERVEPVKPMPIDKPFAGVADDLTQIGGIGPKIQEVLNALGIFHYDQIAEWTPENVAWVDRYLNFEGRISREGWVEQAAVLVGEEADA